VFCYGRTGNTIHIHLVPTDLRPKKKQLGDIVFNLYIKNHLSDALAQLQDVFRKDSTIEEVFAVSPIFYHDNWRNIHESLGFEPIEEILPNSGHDHFIKMFNKNGENSKKVFCTRIRRVELLKKQYERILGIE